MSRAARSALATESLSIIEAGGYTIGVGQWIDLSHSIAEGTSGARLIKPDDARDVSSRQPRPGPYRTQVEVHNETTLTGGRAVANFCGSVPPLCLNFASARSPGGGFLSGAEAQEESIARASTLYPTLMACPSYYDANRGSRSPLYTDNMILSPRVTVFRNDDGSLTAKPFDIAVLTAPAPNAGVARKHSIPEHEIEHIMRRRVANVLAVAAASGYSALVLGAWGCGVFRNDPAFVAGCFRESLRDEYADAFEIVRFSVLDSQSNLPFYGPFAEAMTGWSSRS